MNDEELDRLVAQSTYRNIDVRSLDLRAGEADLMENIMNSTAPTLERPQPLQPSPRPHRRRKLFAALVVGGVVAAGAGVTYAVVTDRLNPDQADVVDEELQPLCDISSDQARLVATVTSGERTVEYWTVDGIDSHGDLLFENDGPFGGGGCGPGARAAVHPQLPWANYGLSADPRDGTGLGHFTFFGQAPPGTASVEIVMNIGTVRIEVTSPDGYFVVLADLPFQAPPPPGESPNPSSPPPTVDVLQSVNAYAADGTLLGTGGPS